MNLKSILNGVSVGLLLSIVKGAPLNIINCESIKNAISEYDTLYSCTENDNGEITSLNFFGNVKEVILPSLSSMKSLEELIISHEYYEEIDLSPIKELENLTTLDVSCYSLARKSRYGSITKDSLSGLKNLENLYLRGCAISEEEDFTGFTNLKDFYFSSIFEQDFVDKIANITSLEKVSLYVDLNSPVVDFTPLHLIGNLTSLDLNSHPYKTSFILNLTDFQYFDQLKQLTISHYPITQKNIDDFSDMNSLEELNLSSCYFDEDINYEPLVNITDHLTSLTHIAGLQGYELTEVPEAYFSLTNLKNLTIGGNDIVGIPEKILNLKNLVNLKFNEQVKDIPIYIKELQNLEYLSLSNVNEIPEFLTELKNIKYLELSGFITEIPEYITKFENLEYLDLSDNDLKTLPSFLNSMNLKYVDFRNNPNLTGKTLTIESLEYCNYDQTSVCKAKELKCFDNKEEYDDEEEIELCKIENQCDEIKSYFEENNITGFDSSCSLDEDNRVSYLYINEEFVNEEILNKLFSYGSIKELYIKLTSQSIFKYMLGKLPQLEKLKLATSERNLDLRPIGSFNNLQSLNIYAEKDQMITLKNKSIQYLLNLKSLVFNNVNLRQENINEIGRLPKLNSLTLNNCNYSKELNYDALRGLQNLSHLELNSNKGKAINKIPDSIYRLRNLTELILVNQNLQRIDSNISKLKNLETLNLKTNKLSTIPESLNELKKLRFVDFTENPRLKGKTLTNKSLETCNYDASSSICKAKEMSCFGTLSTIKKCRK